MSDELSQEELEAIAEEVQQAVLAKVEEALSEIGEEKLSQALNGGLSTWKFAHTISSLYATKFKKFSEQIKLDKADIWTAKLVHNCMLEAVSNIGLSYVLIRKGETGGGLFGGLFGGASTQRTLSDYRSFLDQSFYRITEAGSHLKNAISLHSTEIESEEKKEAEKKKKD